VIQNQLFVSPRHSIIIEYLTDICNMKKHDAEAFIARNMPYLLDINYLGYDENGTKK
jgi:hypothetical protein